MRVRVGAYVCVRLPVRVRACARDAAHEAVHVSVYACAREGAHVFAGSRTCGCVCVRACVREYMHK